jgi:NH3-dependent NAD+ synthetase
VLGISGGVDSSTAGRLAQLAVVHLRARLRGALCCGAPALRRSAG